MPVRHDLLATADWDLLNKSHGSADVARTLLATWSDSPTERFDAYSVLAHVFGGTGPASPADPAAAAFLIDLVAEPDAPDRFAALQILAGIAVGDEYSWLTSQPDLPARRRNVERRAAMTHQELEQEHAAWVAAAPTEFHRQRRLAQPRSLEPDRDDEQWVSQAYDAVRAGVGKYLSALEDPAGVVRMYAAHLLAWFPEDRERIEPALVRLLAIEDEAVVAATACVSAGLSVGTAAGNGLLDAVTARWERGSLGERMVAALGLARLAERPGRSVIEDVYRCLIAVRGNDPHWPFMNGNLGALAALTIRDLDPPVAEDRVDALLRRLAEDEIDTDGEIVFYRALLDSAFPKGYVDDSARYADLSADQQRTIQALVDSQSLRRGVMIRMVVSGYGLPHRETALRTWCEGGQLRSVDR